MSSPRSTLLRSCFAGLHTCALLTLSGCLSQSYEVSAPELERLAQLPPEQRGERVRVTQQTLMADDLGGSEVYSEAVGWELALAANDSGSHGGRRHHRGRITADDGGDASDALTTAVVVVAVAASAAASVAVTEGARFDGWLQAPVDHPLLLVDDDGRRRWSRLETLTGADLRHVERAVLPDLAHDVRRLERHPLDRAGFVYELEFGAEPAPFDAPALAVSGRGGIGFMPAQTYGFLLGAAFSTASRDPAFEVDPLTSTLSFDHRVFLQAEAWPVSAGRWHLGPYAEIGYAWALADDPFGSRSTSGPMLALGAALQLDWTTRLAVTLRAGAAGLPSLDGPLALASNNYRLSPALTVGLSVY